MVKGNPPSPLPQPALLHLPRPIVLTQLYRFFIEKYEMKIPANQERLYTYFNTWK